uniref:Uncharacterized protein n=1 Tax=Lynx canadensis TaxID=61383 RepID=A0A667I477_LYNCA
MELARSSCKFYRIICLPRKSRGPGGARSLAPRSNRASPLGPASQQAPLGSSPEHWLHSQASPSLEDMSPRHFLRVSFCALLPLLMTSFPEGSLPGWLPCPHFQFLGVTPPRLLGQIC